MAGWPIDLNPYRRGDRRSAWARGWHDADRLLADQAAPRPELTEEARESLAHIRRILELRDDSPNQ